MIISKYETLQECRGWGARIPALHFEKEWDVKIIPPFGGAVIRFHISHNNKNVSVYFDGYSELGCVPEPYWEYYDELYYFGFPSKVAYDLFVLFITTFFGNIYQKDLESYIL